MINIIMKCYDFKQALNIVVDKTSCDLKLFGSELLKSNTQTLN